MNHQPLTNAELDRLGDFLDSLPDGAMNLEEYDGFCTGLACAPELVLPEVWLPMVWGETAEQEASFASEAEAREIVDLVMRHSDAVNAGLARGAASKDAFHMPLLLEGDDGQPPQCNDWARGFTRAMRVSPAGWSELLHDEQEGGALVPMLMLVHEHDEDPESRPPEITPDQREELMRHLIAGMHRAYSYFAPHRRAAAIAARQATTFRREQPKVGRNDPCPCGSGRKFKQCCGRTGAVQH